MKNNKEILQTQQKVASLQPNQAIKDNPEIVCEKLSLTDIRLTDNLIKHVIINGDPSPTQEQLGEGIGSRQLTNRLLKKLNALGIVRWLTPVYKKGANTPCTYELGSFFYIKEIRNSLVRFFPSLLNFSLVFMLSLNSRVDQGITPNKEYRNNNYYLYPIKIYSIIHPILRNSSLKMQKKIEFMCFDADMIEIEVRNSEFVACRDYGAWLYDACKKRTAYEGRELKMEVVKQLRKYRSVLESTENNFRAALPKAAPQRVYTDTKQTRDLKREGSGAYREWQGHTEPSKPCVKATITEEEALRKLKADINPLSEYLLKYRERVLENQKDRYTNGKV